MKRLGWFRVLVRLLGLLLIGLGVAPMVSQFGTVGYVIMNWQQGSGSRLNENWLWIVVTLASVVAHTVQVVFGFYLLFSGRRLVAWCLRDVDTVCARCAYDLNGVCQGKCPECGLVLDPTLSAAVADARRET